MAYSTWQITDRKGVTLRVERCDDEVVAKISPKDATVELDETDRRKMAAFLTADL